MLHTGLTIITLAFIQNTSFSVVSRARNRSNMAYHAIASVFSNGIWLLTLRELVVADLALWLVAPYVIGTVAGSLFGAKLSMFIEEKIGAVADAFLWKNPPKK